MKNWDLEHLRHQAVNMRPMLPLHGRSQRQQITTKSWDMFGETIEKGSLLALKETVQCLRRKEYFEDLLIPAEMPSVLETEKGGLVTK